MNNKYSNFKDKKILLAHSNNGIWMNQWHEKRKTSAMSLGYKIDNFQMSEFYPYTIFPYLDKKWKKGDKELLKFYEKLGYKIDECDIFIHYNGALIHPEFLEQFRDKLKIYHCADDPDASPVLSRPVARSYDICAISNPACIDMYKTWGCEKVFFWPLGAMHFDEKYIQNESLINSEYQRIIPLIFIGSKYGVTNRRFIDKLLGIHNKKGIMNKLEHKFPTLVAYGSKWKSGRVDDNRIPDLYSNSLVGINIHNSLGPVNARLYDLAAFGVCQICDNKKNLNSVFTLNSEIIGFDTEDECFDLIEFYINNPIKAQEIGQNAHLRFIKDYTTENIWINFFNNLNNALTNS
jgi:spore maturation protein CgeB